MIKHTSCLVRNRLHDTDLCGADLSEASWWVLREAKLGIPVFRHANLAGANLSGLHLGAAPDVGRPD